MNEKTALKQTIMILSLQANFQFEFFQRLGLACPSLKVLDLFNTDTWADCLVALFFKDAFHSLHRYLYFYSSTSPKDQQHLAKSRPSSPMSNGGDPQASDSQGTDEEVRRE